MLSVWLSCIDPVCLLPICLSVCLLEALVVVDCNRCAGVSVALVALFISSDSPDRVIFWGLGGKLSAVGRLAYYIYYTKLTLHTGFTFYRYWSNGKLQIVDLGSNKLCPRIRVSKWNGLDVKKCRRL